HPCWSPSDPPLPNGRSRTKGVCVSQSSTTLPTASSTSPTTTGAWPGVSTSPTATISPRAFNVETAAGHGTPASTSSGSAHHAVVHPTRRQGPLLEDPDQCHVSALLSIGEPRAR